MIGAVSEAGRGHQAAGPEGPGRSARTVGQRARAAVAAAREAGAEVPGNAQGLAARAIARGADPASLFAARVATGDGAGDGGDSGDPRAGTVGETGPGDGEAEAAAG